MEQYVNNVTLKEDEISKMFKDSATCPICKSILIDPFICLKCQKAFCQKCIGKNDILSKLKFFCVGCQAEITYDKAESHHNSCCPEKTSSGFVKNKSKIKRLSSEEVNKYKQQGSELTYITGKKIN